ncbi:MAG: hypothetical protein LBG99_05625 [Propionibacteriaceae bacterium]|jgi:hypothetical protein|nr:hypothetical protein [Propionibacteriaceae bacterium]
MSLQIDEDPWGAARFAYSYLGALVAGLAAGVIVVIAWPILGSLPICRSDQGGFCTPIIAAVVGVVALIGCLVAVGYIFRLTWVWAAWMLALSLIITQVLIDYSEPNIAWAIVAVPLFAGLLTFSRPDKPMPRVVTILTRVALVMTVAQFIYWLILLIILPA